MMRMKNSGWISSRTLSHIHGMTGHGGRDVMEKKAAAWMSTRALKRVRMTLDCSIVDEQSPYAKETASTDWIC